MKTEPDLRARATPRRALWGAVATLAALSIGGCTMADPKAPQKQQLDGVSWQRAQIQLPAGSGMDCPTGLHQLAPSDTPGGMVAWAKGSVTNNFVAEFPAVGAGDLTGDGENEMVLRVRCTPLEPSQEQNTDMPGQLLIVKIDNDSHIFGLAYVGPAYAQYPYSKVVDGQLHTQVWYEEEGSQSVYAPAHMRSYQWTGEHFIQVAGRTSPLILAPAKAATGAPITLPAIRHRQTVICAANRMIFTGAEGHTALATYSVTGNAQLVDIDGNGDQELLAEIACNIGEVTRISLYLLAQKDDSLLAIDVPVANDGTLHIESGWKMSGADLTVTIRDLASGEKAEHIMHWNGTTFLDKVGHVGSA